MYAKVLFIENPVIEEFPDDLSLLMTAAQFWHVARVLHHRQGIEVCCCCKEHNKQHVLNDMRRPCHCHCQLSRRIFDQL